MAVGEVATLLTIIRSEEPMTQPGKPFESRTTAAFLDAAVRMLRDRLCKCSSCEFAKDLLGMPKLAGDWTRFPEGAEL